MLFLATDDLKVDYQVKKLTILKYFRFNFSFEN